MVKPEPLILLNSHDGTGSYQLMSGVFRIVCRNGLIVSEGEAHMIRVPHKADIIGEVIEGDQRTKGHALRLGFLGGRNPLSLVLNRISNSG
jgi:hypothetical protein